MSTTVTLGQEHFEALEKATADGVKCLTCDATGKLCSGCDNPQEVCSCEFGCSTLVDCGDCKGTGTKPAYAPDPAGAMDLRDDEPMPAWKVELVARIQAAEYETQMAETDYLTAKETTKECKEILEGKIAWLRKLIRELDAAEKPMPLLDGLDKPAETNGQPMAANDAWRSLCIDTLCQYGKVERIVQMLREKSLETMGDLADFQNKHGDFWAKKIKGLGPAKAQQVGEAWMKFWDEHPEYCGTN